MFRIKGNKILSKSISYFKNKKNTTKKTKNKNKLKDDKIISIAEKVKFWEEQDRINEAMIPRILNNYDLITKLTSKIDENNGIITDLRIENDKFKKEIIKLKTKKLDIIKNLLPVYIIAIVALIISVISILI